MESTPLRALPRAFFGGCRVESDDLHESTIQARSVPVTSGELLTMLATPVVLVPAPGAGKWVEMISVAFYLDAGASAFTTSGENLQLRYKDAAGQKVAADIDAGGLLQSTVDLACLVHAINHEGWTVAQVVNQPVVLSQDGIGEFGGNDEGDAVLWMRLSYRVHRTGG